MFKKSYSLKCLLTEDHNDPSQYDLPAELQFPKNSKGNQTNLTSPEYPKPDFVTQLAPNLQLSLHPKLSLDFSDKVLDLLLDKSKSAFLDTLKNFHDKDPKKFLNLFKSNLSNTIQNEDLLNYFNLLIPSISIQTDDNSHFKNLQLDFNLNHDSDTKSKQLGLSLKGEF